MVERARLVLITGAPGSGKTTLAAAVAERLRLPLLSRDALKEILFDTLGCPDRAASRAFGAASFALLFAVAERLLDAGVGAVLESNVRRGTDEPNLGPLTARCPAVTVHCQATAALLTRRFTKRAAQPGRHPGHFDTTALPEVRAALAAGAFEPLDLPIPVLRVDTSSAYAPSLPEILDFARTGRPASKG